MDNSFQTLSKLKIETFIRKILNKYLEPILHHGKKNSYNNLIISIL